jgi:hypothetical protein
MMAHTARKMKGGASRNTRPAPSENSHIQIGPASINTTQIHRHNIHTYIHTQKAMDQGAPGSSSGE